MPRPTVIALLAVVLAGCSTRQEPPWDGKIFDDNLRGRGALKRDANLTAEDHRLLELATGLPPMPPDLSPSAQQAVSAERRRLYNRYRSRTPHVIMQPGDTNIFVGPLPTPLQP